MESGQKITSMDLPEMRSFHHCAGAAARLQQVYQEVNHEEVEAAAMDCSCRSLEGKGRRGNIWSQLGKSDGGPRQDQLGRFFTQCRQATVQRRAWCCQRKEQALRIRKPVRVSSKMECRAGRRQCVSRNLEGRYRKRYQTMLIRVDENKTLVLPGGLHRPPGASVIFSHHVGFAARPLMSSPLFTFEPWLSRLWRI